MIAPPPLVYLVGLLVGFGLEALLPAASVPGAVAWPVGAAILAAGLCLVGWFFYAFRRARTPVAPYKPTTALVTTGPFRVSRNPAYLSLALIYVGIAILARAPWALLTLAPTLALIHQGVIKREERYLERKFGDEYRRYRARVRRWV